MLAIMVLKEDFYGMNWSSKNTLWGRFPWLLLGDFNVTMDISEHSAGRSHRTMDMQEFKDTVNNLELDDICSNGFHFTWTKSLKNPKCDTLKKLDRMMINEEFT
ncbi:RNA-directed DNA polymerase, eukaryota, reverse transcriptase zinc-binding domain protein, partial [Tanacetum coccineum]